LSGTTNSLVATGVTGICNFAATFPAVFWIDRWGRKPTLISGAFIQALAMFVIGGIFQTQTSLVDGNLVMNSTSATNTVIAFIFIFTLAFAYSWGACGFIYPAEIFPMRVRAKVLFMFGWKLDIVVLQRIDHILFCFRQLLLPLVQIGFSLLSLPSSLP
jgi:hypothetical protein